MFRILSTHLRPLVGAPTRCAYQQAVGNSVVSHPPISKQFVQMMSYDSSNKTHNKIHSLISKSNKGVFVFMKGVPKEPSCRYSAIVVQILDAYGVDFDSSDVLEDSDIRQEIKTYSDWPTIPQVYKDGQFIGGCDILLQMHQSGELKQLFGDDPKSKSDQKA